MNNQLNWDRQKIQEELKSKLELLSDAVKNSTVEAGPIEQVIVDFVYLNIDSFLKNLDTISDSYKDVANELIQTLTGILDNNPDALDEETLIKTYTELTRVSVSLQPNIPDFIDIDNVKTRELKYNLKLRREVVDILIRNNALNMQKIFADSGITINGNYDDNIEAFFNIIIFDEVDANDPLSINIDNTINCGQELVNFLSTLSLQTTPVDAARTLAFTYDAAINEVRKAVEKITSNYGGDLFINQLTATSSNFAVATQFLG